MTDLAPPPSATAAPAATAVYPGPTTPRRDRGGRRRGIAAVTLAALVLSAVTRYGADAARTAALGHGSQQAVSSTSLSNMDSFALGLLLGGLRGPLVMILWTDSENQKTEKNLEGVDSEIEWIRLLQPEFDTVHLFQIWNKAYNISVQMASLANKYDTILGALAYAHNVDQQKPNDINILGAVGQLFFDKLGTSAEKAYYRRRVREDSVAKPGSAAARRPSAAGEDYRLTALPPAVDADGNLLAGRRDDLAALANRPQYAPYTDGVSAFAYAYNYYKRCDDLLVYKHQHHDQLSDVVIDSRPGLSLKNWADDEVARARMREAQALGLAPDKVEAAVTLLATAAAPDQVTADVTLAAGAAAIAADPARRAQVSLAIADYDRAVRIVPDATAEYERHIKNSPDRAQQYQLYMAEILAEQQMATGDRDYLQAMLVPAGPARDALLADARSAYTDARDRYDVITLRYYTDYRLQQAVIPHGYATLPTGDQQPLDQLPEPLLLAAIARATQLQAGSTNLTDPTSDWNEYQVHVYRLDRRLSLLGAATTQP